MFDFACHLIGEQAIPNYLAIKEIQSKIHVLYATQKTEKVATRLKKLFPAEKIEIFLINAFDLKSLEEDFKIFVDKITASGRNCSIALNLTGGTKPMSIKLLQAFDHYENKKIFYIESFPQRKLLFFNDNEETPIYVSINEVETFVRLHCDAPLQKVEVRDVLKGEIVEFLWKFYQKDESNFRYFTGEFANSLSPSRFDKKISKTYEYFSEEILNKYKNEIDPKGSVDEILRGFIKTGHEEEVAKFLAGGWFECFIYRRLQQRPEFKNGQYKDLQLNSLVKKENDENTDAQEFDVSFTDGIYLYIIECKSGNVKQEHFQKLKNLAIDYGGSYGRGILCCASHCIKGKNGKYLIRDRVHSDLNKHVMLVDGWNVDFIFDAIEQWKAGRFEPAKK